MTVATAVDSIPKGVVLPKDGAQQEMNTYATHTYLESKDHFLESTEMSHTHIRIREHQDLD